MACFRLSVTFRPVDEAHVTVEGTVEPEKSRQLAALLVTLVDIGARQLLVDLARVDTCDPEFPVFLNGLRRRLVSLGGWMVVDGPPTTPDDDTLPLHDLFTIYTRVAGSHLPIVRGQAGIGGHAARA